MMKPDSTMLATRQTVFAAARKLTVANTVAALKTGDVAAICAALDESIALREAQVAALGSGLPPDIANAIFPEGDPRVVRRA